MRYTVQVDPRAARDLRKLSKVARARVKNGIERLTVGLSSDCRKLAGYANLYRLRVGEYRIAFSRDRGKLTILVIQVGHRREIYRKLRLLLTRGQRR
ncbi:MAG: type II toxin-antitoxin system RelE/ParE family toxin [Myxococcota bacterium]